MKFLTPLYRYQKVSEGLAREKELLIENKLYFVSPRTFNDPFDSKPHIVFSKQGQVSHERAMEAVQNQSSDLSRSQRRFIQKRIVKQSQNSTQGAKVRAQLKDAVQGICNAVSMKCFSASADSILQWSHYADGHKGYCAGFDFPKRWPYMDRTGYKSYIPICEVKYRAEYHAVDMDSRFLTKEEREVLFDALIIKSEQWSYEHEWRALRINTAAGSQDFSCEVLRSIVFGAAMEEPHKTALKELLAQRPTPVEIFECRLADERFELVLESRGHLGGG